ncbi:MAG: hypothetical protein L0H24_11770 [Microlunatus sp.]|nr:hypothetical protein [Microlunatus sp.]
MEPAERERRHQARLVQMAKSLGIKDPPKIDPLQWIYPEEVGTFRVPCLRAQGFQAWPSADGRGYKTDMGSVSQQEAYNLASYTCNAQYPLDPRADPSIWTRDQHTVVYQYLTDSLIPCLRRIGANPAEAPTLPVYLANPGTAWEYPDPGGRERMELWYGTCPIDPPTKVILGE